MKLIIVICISCAGICSTCTSLKAEKTGFFLQKSLWAHGYQALIYTLGIPAPFLLPFSRGDLLIVP